MKKLPRNLERFSAQHAQDIARAFDEAGVDYLFIGKGGAIILGYPGTTQDVDVYLPKDRKNAQRVVRALERLNYELDSSLKPAILGCKDFIQITAGPFKLDLVHAPDGIKNYASAKARSVQQDEFRVANLKDIIASKRAAGRAKDLMDLYLLERFAVEYERAHAKPLFSVVEKVKYHKPGIKRRTRR